MEMQEKSKPFQTAKQTLAKPRGVSVSSVSKEHGEVMNRNNAKIQVGTTGGLD